GAASAAFSDAGIRARCCARTTARSASAPCTVYPEFNCRAQYRSRPERHSSHSPQVAARNVIPTRSPTATLLTPGPTDSTCPLPSGPKISGTNGGRSNPATKRSEWQIPQASIRTSASPAPGSGVLSALTDTSPRGAVNTAAILSTSLIRDDVTIRLLCV